MFTNCRPSTGLCLVLCMVVPSGLLLSWLSCGPWKAIECTRSAQSTSARPGEVRFAKLNKEVSYFISLSDASALQYYHARRRNSCVASPERTPRLCCHVNHNTIHKTVHKTVHIETSSILCTSLTVSDVANICNRQSLQDLALACVLISVKKITTH